MTARLSLGYYYSSPYLIKNNLSLPCPCLARPLLPARHELPRFHNLIEFNVDSGPSDAARRERAKKSNLRKRVMQVRWKKKAIICGIHPDVKKSSTKVIKYMSKKSNQQDHNSWNHVFMIPTPFVGSCSIDSDYIKQRGIRHPHCRYNHGGAGAKADPNRPAPGRRKSYFPTR